MCLRHLTYDINLADNQAVQVGLVWSPDQASGSQLRGYFIEVLFDGEKIWTMPNNYPPRLTVEAMKTGYIRVIDAFWVKNGIRIISAELGDRVEAHVVVKAFNGQFYGGVKIKIKKDIPLAPDEDFAEADFNIILEEGQETDLTVVFRPDEPSSSRLRGYFIEVLVGGQGTWTMVDDYPPRLTVARPRAGIPVVIDAFWIKDGVKVVSVNLGDRTEAHVTIQASGGNVEGIIRVKIRKDIAFAPDEDFVEKVFEVRLGEGQTVELVIEFRPNQRSGTFFRGLFIEVELITWNQHWTMPDEYPPRLRIY